MIRASTAIRLECRAAARESRAHRDMRDREKNCEPGHAAPSHRGEGAGGRGEVPSDTARLRMKPVNPTHLSGFSDSGTGDSRSMEEILADIRRTAAIEPPTLGELKGAALPRGGNLASDSTSSQTIAVAPARAANQFTDQFTDDFTDRVPDSSPDTASDQAPHQTTAADRLDLPAILKGRRPAGVARQLRSLNRQGLTDVLRNAGMLRGAAPAVVEPEVVTSQQFESDDHLPDEPTPPSQIRSIATIAAVAPPRRRLPEEIATGGEQVHAVVGHAVALATALEVDLNRRRMRIAACGGVDVGPESVPDPRTAAQDAAAELLRPMLRQWLAENMPRIVESALHMEIANPPGIAAKNG